MGLLYHTTKLLGGILVSLRPSICSSVHPSVHPPRIPCLLCSAYSSGWIHFIFNILLCNFRKCVASKISCKISKLKFLAIFLKFETLTLTWDLKWITAVSNHEAVGVVGVVGVEVSQNAGVLIVLVLYIFMFCQFWTDKKFMVPLCVVICL